MQWREERSEDISPGDLSSRSLAVKRTALKLLLAGLLGDEGEARVGRVVLLERRGAERAYLAVELMDFS